MQTRNMNKEFIPYEQALALKELGFDEPCFAHFVKHYDEIKCILNSDDFDEWWTNNSDNLNVKAPLYQQAFRWFREKYNLHAEPYTADMGAIEYCFQIRDLYSEKYIYDNFRGAGNSYMGTFNTPEEAELACLNKLIEIVKNG
jgi:hypothetical protein